ncbi:hypothetical protein B7494_g4054 [Chlorociboria aeruginascens]|nr:hypothetical protein B7494_g4054 [Chlorociboria aeruginascens]
MNSRSQGDGYVSGFNGPRPPPGPPPPLNDRPPPSNPIPNCFGPVIHFPAVVVNELNLGSGDFIQSLSSRSGVILVCQNDTRDSIIQKITRLLFGGWFVTPDSVASIIGRNVPWVPQQTPNRGYLRVRWRCNSGTEVPDSIIGNDHETYIALLAMKTRGWIDHFVMSWSQRAGRNEIASQTVGGGPIPIQGNVMGGPHVPQQAPTQEHWHCAQHCYVHGSHRRQSGPQPGPPCEPNRQPEFEHRRQIERGAHGNMAQLSSQNPLSTYQPEYDMQIHQYGPQSGAGPNCPLGHIAGPDQLVSQSRRPSSWAHEYQDNSSLQDGPSHYQGSDSQGVHSSRNEEMLLQIRFQPAEEQMTEQRRPRNKEDERDKEYNDPVAQKNKKRKLSLSNQT